MKIHDFCYSVAINLSIRRDEYKSLCAAAVAHYDYACRREMLPGGTLFTWETTFGITDLDNPGRTLLPEDCIEVEVTSRMLNRLMKICEGDEVLRDLRKQLRAAMDAIDAELRRLNPEVKEAQS